MWILTVSLIIVAIGLLVLLYFIKRKKRIVGNIESRKNLNKIKGTDKKVESTKESLNHLNKLSREFFKNYLKVKNELTFKEMAEIFRRKNEDALAEFCEKMDFYTYSGKEITKQEVLGLIDTFIVITKRYKIKGIKKEKEKAETKEKL